MKRWFASEIYKGKTPQSLFIVVGEAPGSSASRPAAQGPRSGSRARRVESCHRELPDPQSPSAPFLIRNPARIPDDFELVVAEDRSRANEAVSAVIHRQHEQVHAPDRFVKHAAGIGRSDIRHVRMHVGDQSVGRFRAIVPVEFHVVCASKSFDKRVLGTTR